MNILDFAIKTEGSVTKLARALSLEGRKQKQNTISNWRARGIPDGWFFALTLKYGKRMKKDMKKGQP